MTSRLPVSQPEHSPSWHAELHLGFARNGDAAVRKPASWPVARAEGVVPGGHALCQAIVQHPPSSIAGGDYLAISAEVSAGAHAQLTTLKAGKWYRSGGAEASQCIDFIRERGMLA